MAWGRGGGVPIKVPDDFQDRKVMTHFHPMGTNKLKILSIVVLTWSNIPLSHSYCNNSGQSKTGLSNLEWYYSMMRKHSLSICVYTIYSSEMKHVQ